MKKLPYVTIIIPYKNNLEYLFIALKSIFKQSYKNFKILIVYDDEDKTDLFKIKKFFKNPLFKRKISYKIIVNKYSLGAGYARNVGIKKSNTKYLAFLDSDDIWDKNKLNIQINFMERRPGDIAQVFSDTKKFKNLLKWKPRHNDINKIIKSAINWEAKLKIYKKKFSLK